VYQNYGSFEQDTFSGPNTTLNNFSRRYFAHGRKCTMFYMLTCLHAKYAKCSSLVFGSKNRRCHAGRWFPPSVQWWSSSAFGCRLSVDMHKQPPTIIYIVGGYNSQKIKLRNVMQVKRPGIYLRVVSSM